MPYLMIVGDALRGWLGVERRAPDGMERIECAVKASRTDGESLHLTYTLLLLARARGMLGNTDEGRAVAREGLSWTHDHGQRYLEAELWRADGELAAAGGDMAEAKSSLRTACRVAATQGAEWLELRALVSLARLFPDQSTLDRLGARCEATPSGHELPPFRDATALLSGSVE